ncbi:hypothetical protein COOONC_24446 [Cooperia oncophora]
MAKRENSKQQFSVVPLQDARLRQRPDAKRENEEVFPGVLNKVKATFWPPAYFPGMRTKQFFFWRSMKDHTEGIPEVVLLLIFDPIRLILSMLLGFSLSDFTMILYSLVSLSLVVWLVQQGKYV